MGTLKGFPNPPALWLWRAKPAFAYAMMGTLGGFASPFGPPPATPAPLAALGLAKPWHLTGAWFALAHKPPVPPRSAQQSWATLARETGRWSEKCTPRQTIQPSRDGPPPARARAKRAGRAGWRAVPKSPQGAEPAGSPREFTWEPWEGSLRPSAPHPPPPPRSLRSASPNPPALWLRRAKPAFAYAIMGTLRGFPCPRATREI